MPEKRPIDGVLLICVSPDPASTPSKRRASVGCAKLPEILTGPPRNCARISLVRTPFSENSRSPCIWLSSGISGMKVKALSANWILPSTWVSSVFINGTFSLSGMRQLPVPRASSSAPSSNWPSGELSDSAR